jgi:hypothetical protein
LVNEINLKNFIKLLKKNFFIIIIFFFLIEKKKKKKKFIKIYKNRSTKENFIVKNKKKYGFKRS